MAENRVTQEYIEAIAAEPNANALVTQVYIEVIGPIDDFRGTGIVWNGGFYPSNFLR